jgi:hypothetical protein
MKNEKRREREREREGERVKESLALYEWVGNLSEVRMYRIFRF